MAEKPAPPTFDEILNLALKITSALGFALDEQARTFGYMEAVGNNPGYLKKVVKRMNHEAVEHRSRIVILIREQLDTMFGEDYGAMKRWVGVKHPELDHESVKSLMACGECRELERALVFVQAIPKAN